MIVDHLTRIARAATVREAWSIHMDLMSSYGFDRALYVSARFRSEHSIGDLQDALVLSEHEPGYVHAMIGRGLVRHAPMVLRTEPGGVLWGSETPPTSLAALAVEARGRFGLAAGCDVVLGEVSCRAWGGIELCARAGLTPEEVAAIWERHGDEIEFLCNLTHLKIAHLPSWAGRQPLTPKQRCVLRWAAEGKTAQETALILGLSQATVEKHLRLAREALDVQTTAQAVSKAAHWNQLLVEEGLRLAG